MENQPLLANLFPRKNQIGGPRRQPNLSEIRSQTLQKYGGGGAHDCDDPGDAGGGCGMFLITATWRELHTYFPNILTEYLHFKATMST